MRLFAYAIYHVHYGLLQLLLVRAFVSFCDKKNQLIKPDLNRNGSRLKMQHNLTRI